MTTTEPPVAFLCYGPEGECLNCGGSNRPGVEEPWVCDHGTYCSEECLTEAGEYIDRVRAEEAHRRTNWCPTCGYDQWEHDPTCAVPAADRPSRYLRVS